MSWTSPADTAGITSSRAVWRCAGRAARRSRSELIKRARSVREIRGLDDARDAANRLASLTVRLETKAGGGGRLFGSVSPADIAAAVLAAGGPELDKRRIEIKNPIKTVGAHQVAIRLHPEVRATLDIEVAAS